MRQPSSPHTTSPHTSSLPPTPPKPPNTGRPSHTTPTSSTDSFVDWASAKVMDSFMRWGSSMCGDRVIRSFCRHGWQMAEAGASRGGGGRQLAGRAHRRAGVRARQTSLLHTKHDHTTPPWGHHPGATPRPACQAASPECWAWRRAAGGSQRCRSQPWRWTACPPRTCTHRHRQAGTGRQAQGDS